MKVLCDVCGKEGASVLCCADEAALCDACDRRVHRANKLAGKHRRFSLSAQSHPACDICQMCGERLHFYGRNFEVSLVFGLAQEKRGFLFCQEDRAILCRDCDASVHSANHLTMKHNRFILTGVHLSAAPISSSPSPESVAEAKTSTKSAVPMSNQNKASVADGSTPIASTSTTTGSSATAAGTVTSSISEYLTKTCPGWRVEDLLVDDAAFGVEDFAKVPCLGASRAPVPSAAGSVVRRRRLATIAREQGGGARAVERGRVHRASDLPCFDSQQEAKALFLSYQTKNKKTTTACRRGERELDHKEMVLTVLRAPLVGKSHALTPSPR
ncbi:hypothetical protein GW17_00041560 [Ensete ventricosum]|nr:hypothetical protein GW17_00041560 [Ensete ventricosum]